MSVGEIIANQIMDFSDNKFRSSKKKYRDALAELVNTMGKASFDKTDELENNLRKVAKDAKIPNKKVDADVKMHYWDPIAERVNHRSMRGSEFRYKYNN